MNAKELKKVILFMANQWSEQKAVEIFGSVMGRHFFAKWSSKDSPDLGTMRLFYEFDNKYLQILLDYINENYNG